MKDSSICEYKVLRLIFFVVLVFNTGVRLSVSRANLTPFCFHPGGFNRNQNTQSTIRSISFMAVSWHTHTKLWMQTVYFVYVNPAALSIAGLPASGLFFCPVT